MRPSLWRRATLLILTVIILPTALIALGAFGFIVGVMGAWLGRGLTKA